MDFKEKYFEIWKTAWDFHKKWCNHNNTNSEWKKIIDESDCIRKKYKDIPEYQFMEDLMLIVISEMEGGANERRDGTFYGGCERDFGE